jgi:hypothetical protein
MNGLRVLMRSMIMCLPVLLAVACGSSAQKLQAPTITGVAGNWPGSPTIMKDGVLVTGTGLAAATFQLRTGGTATPLAVRSQQDTIAEVLVPGTFRSGSYELVATSVGGSASFALALTLPSYTGDELVATVNSAATQLAMSVMPAEVGGRLSTLEASVPDMLASRLSTLESRMPASLSWDPGTGNVGIGTASPAARLHVAGGIRVDEDAGLLRGANCRWVTLTDPGAGDLGDQLAGLLLRNACVYAMLAKNTGWTWNKRLDIPEGQILHVWGDGYANVAQNITVDIYMTQNIQVTRCDGSTPMERSPGRVTVGSYAEFWLEGVRVTANIPSDGLALAGQAGYGGSLFNCWGQSSELTLRQIRITTTEDVAGIGSQGFCNVRFGHTFIDRQGTTGTIQAAKFYGGCSLGGGFGFVHASHTTLGANVQLVPTAKVFVSN